jgi:exodeoxyribonuclease V beta subunit
MPMIKPLALSLPLHGRQWIEASAGTGKTFTLSLLVLRLLLEREIPLPNILAVTFTKAATQELKIKIRAQITLAQESLKKGATEDSATAILLQSLLQQKTEKQLQQLLAVAIQDCDRTSIFTIHGFCARVLNDHALSAGQVLQAPSLLTNTTMLNTRIAFDLWREFSADRHLMRSLIKLWPNPELLARACDSLLQAKYLLPAVPVTLPNEFEMSTLNEGLRTALALHLASARHVMLQAQRSGILHGSHMSQSIIDGSFEKLENWYAVNSDLPFEDPGFSRLSTSHIVLKVKKEHKKQTPTSPLFDAIDAWYQGFAQLQALEEARDIQCLHLVRQRLAQRRHLLLQKLQQYSYDDLIAQVVQALEGESGNALAQALRKDYPVALVDEFQDTDSQQWKIFSMLYPQHEQEHALYLIGDPKQAIYGFRGGDVHAYLAAKQESKQHWNLSENFRSRPCLLSAVASLFEQGGDNAFREQDIHFYPVQAGGGVQDDDFLWNKKAAPAMHLALLPEHIDQQKQKATALPAAKARELATRACVEKIHELLSAGQQNTAQILDKENKEMRGVQPGDIAVLVNQNKEAVEVQAALSAYGIASVISSQENLFRTFEAQELFIILDALTQHQDQARWRGALSTVLLGYHAEEILQLETDAAAATRSADLAVQYRELWLHEGILSLLAALCAKAAARILPLSDGERRLSNYLQLAETLQQASAIISGPEQCLRWLGQAMQDVSVDEENTLRLDSDQKRVKILTLHKSKGLEFPLVFMPFANLGKSSKTHAGVNLLNYHEQHQRISHALVYSEHNKKFTESIKSCAAQEQLAEQIRLLYVGLTRAQHYCWVCCGSVYQADKSGLSSLLFRNDKDEIKTPVRADFLAKLKYIQHRNPAILVDEISHQKRRLPRFKNSADTPVMQIALPVTHLQKDWRVSSFSQLTHGSSHQSPTVSPADDEAEPSRHLPEANEEVFDRRFSGIAFGNALHHALENIDIAAWAHHEKIHAAPESELPLLQQSLLRQGYTQDELAAGAEQLTPLIFNTLRTTLPEGLRLCDLPTNARLNEMEFHFSLRECDTQDLLALLKRYGILQQREEFPFSRRLNGLMTGKVDLIYRHKGLLYVCDYKSNRLPSYDAERCLQAMRESEYDFQALIYTLALHRWCKFRLSSAYDYDTHLGGVRYLFCRGLNADSDYGEGIVALRFERVLIEQLDVLLHPVQVHAA